MRREMPQRYWRNLPESVEIQTLLRDGQATFAQRQREAMDLELAKARAMQRVLAQRRHLDRRGDGHGRIGSGKCSADARGHVMRVVVMADQELRVARRSGTVRWWTSG